MPGNVLKHFFFYLEQGGLLMLSDGPVKDTVPLIVDLVSTVHYVCHGYCEQPTLFGKVSLSGW